MATITAEQESRRALLAEVKDRWETTLLAIPGVTGVGVGFKWVRGKPTDELAIRVYVREKKRVPESERIPRRLDGYPTDVMELDPRPLPATIELPTREEIERLAADTGRYDPLVGGISVGPCREIGDIGHIAGTLGLIVKDGGAANVDLMLSNAHVFCGDDGNANVGDEMGQPSRIDSYKPWCQDCAELLRFTVGDYIDPAGVNLGGVDGAVARVTKNRGSTAGRIQGIGQITGFMPAALNMNVSKRGRTTELTQGIVEDVDATFTSDWGPQFGIRTLHKQILVRGAPNHFSQGGDSGSIVVNVDGQKRKVVGLLWGGSTVDPYVSIVSPIAAVIGALNIRLE